MTLLRVFEISQHNIGDFMFQENVGEKLGDQYIMDHLQPSLSPLFHKRAFEDAKNYIQSLSPLKNHTLCSFFSFHLKFVSDFVGNLIW